MIAINANNVCVFCKCIGCFIISELYCTIQFFFNLAQTSAIYSTFKNYYKILVRGLWKSTVMNSTEVLSTFRQINRNS